MTEMLLVGPGDKMWKMHLQTLKLEGQVGVNSSIFTLPISKTKNSNNKEWIKDCSKPHENHSKIS